MIMSLLRARSSGDRGGALGQHAGDLGAELDGAALVVDRLAGGAAAAAAASSAASSSLVPISALAAASTSSTVGATAPSADAGGGAGAAASSVRLTPQPTTAMSISVRGMKRR